MTPLPNPPSAPRTPSGESHEFRTTDRPRHARVGARRTLLAFAVVGLLLLCGFWFSPAKVPEAPRAELVLQQGRLFHPGQTAPFTGRMTELYPSGAKKSRSMVVNGLLHGISEGWHTNGQLAVREHFQAGISHGWRTKWFAGGAKMSEANIVNGQLQGTFRRWHENGVLAEQIEMRHGNVEGLARAYYPSGFLKAQARMQEGKLMEQRFWPDGECKASPLATERAN
jgi:hypothetical protein